MRKMAFAFALAALMLCGCSSKKDQPEDTPCNRGLIMETENGYYTNYVVGASGIALRFYERDTENQIFLCAKPECLHNGSDTCAATYKNLSCLGSILYDGAIYNYTIEKGDTVSLSLYKAELDGTSFTKVGDVFTVSNSSGEENMDMMNVGFIIHKGYAYISYHLSLGDSSYGFAGSGLAKMDISNGRTELLWSGEDYFSYNPYDLCGSGDYVYYSLPADDGGGFYRYDIKSEETERLWDRYPIVGENKFFIIELDGNGKQSVWSCGKEKSDIEKADAEGLDLVAGGFEDSIDKLISYKDKIIVVHGGEISVYSEEGESLGEISYTDGDKDLTNIYYDVAVSEDKLYLVDNYAFRTLQLYEDKYEDAVFSCPIEDVISGKGKWKFEYGVMDLFSIDNWEIGDSYANDRN